MLFWYFFFTSGANIRMKIGCVCHVKTCSVADLWTDICSSIFVKLIIVWPSVSGTYESWCFYLLCALWVWPPKFLCCLFHWVILSNSDLSVWCFSCDAYLDAHVIQQLRPVHEMAYVLKFGELPPVGAS